MPPTETTRLTVSRANPQLRALADEFDYVCRVLRRFGVLERNLDDVAQDVFEVVCRHWSDYRQELPLRPWLTGIAANVARRHLARVWRETPAGYVEVEDLGPQPDEQLASERMRALAVRCLATLSPPDRALLALHDMEGVPVRQVAEQMSVPLFTVYTRLRRARLRFAHQLQKLQRLPPPGGNQPRRGPRPVRVLLPALGLPAAPTPRPDALGGRRFAVRPAWPMPFSRAWMAAGAAGAVAAAVTALVVAALQLPAIAAAGGRIVVPDRPPAFPPEPAAGRERLLAALAHARGAPALRLSRPAPAHATLGDGLSGYWRFEEGPGSARSRDRSAAGRDCALRAVDPQRAWVAGPLGSAIDPGNGWIECPRPALPVRPDTELSVSAWVRVENPAARAMAIVSRQLAEGREDYFFLGLIGRRLRVRSSLWAVHVDGPALPRGAWVHVAFTHAADGSVRLYQNGVEVGRRRSHQRHTVMVATPVAIGAGINGPGDSLRGEQLSGAVDEVMIHDRALSPAEVAALAQHGPLLELAQ